MRVTGTFTSEESKDQKEIGKAPGLGNKGMRKLKSIASIFTPESRSPRPHVLRQHDFKSGTGALSNQRETESIDNLLRTSKNDSKDTEKSLWSKDKQELLMMQLNALAIE